MFFILITLVSFFISYTITPYIVQLGKKQNITDKPGYRKIHDDAVPNLGGIVILFGFLLSVLIFVPLQKQIQIFIAGSIIIFLLGIVDDISDLKALNKFVIQIIPGLFFIICNNDIISLYILQKLDFLKIVGYLIYPIILLWIVGITNAFNLIDGLDGLASGVAIISLTAFTIIGFWINESYNIYNLLNSALLGSMTAFFCYNFYPAQIFLGDSGSTFIGFFIACTSVIWVIYSGEIMLSIIPIIILSLPIFDTFFAIWRRIINHKPIFLADQGHMHHRLLNRGMSHRSVVLFLLSISGIFSIVALILVWLRLIK